MTSHSSRFLAQMEAKRLQRPCARMLDMRGKVPGECKRYEHDGRIFWLDDISYAIFKRGLEKSGGVFTWGTYEAMANGPHTNRAIRDAQEARRAEEAAAEAVARRAEELEQTGEPRKEERRGPEFVTFGYFKRRREDRVQFATRIEIRVGEITYWAKTSNLSVHGLMAYLRGHYNFEIGQSAYLTFADFQEKAGPDTPLTAIRYTVMATHQAGDSIHTVRLRLDQASADPAFVEFIEKFIVAYRRRNKLDVNDDARATSSRLHERLYVENLVGLPLFIARTAQGTLSTRAVALSFGNGHLARFFHLFAHTYEFLALAVPSRLERLRDLGEIVVALFREDDGKEVRIYSADDGEFDDPEEFLRFAAYALSRPKHLVLKLAAGCQPLRMPQAGRFERASRMLGENWGDGMDQIKNIYDSLVLSGMAVDFTDTMRTLIEHATDFMAKTPSRAGLVAWCERERLDLGKNKVLERLGEEQMPDPEVADFGLLRSRREIRYRAATSVQLKLTSGSVEASSRDISLRGMCVVVERPVVAEVGEKILVGLTTLQKKRPNLNLMRIPYRIVKILPGAENLIMLQRLTDHSSGEIDNFFEELIESNRSKLSLDEASPRVVASAYAWEAVAVENLATIPFFFGRRDEEGLQIRAIGFSYDPCCRLVEFFQNPDGEFDFSPVTNSQITLTLRERFMPLQREGNVRGRRPDPLTIEVYIYKEWDPETGQAHIHSVDDRMLASRQQRAQFIRKALEYNDHRFIRITATYVQAFEESYRSELLQIIHRQANYKALQLDDHLVSLEGYGEMVDITDELESAFRYLG